MQIRIFSRYILDYCFQYGYRRIPLWQKRFLLSVMPGSTRTFFLLRDISTIYIQKPELSPSELKYQYKKINSLLKKSKSSFNKVDNNISSEASSNFIVNTILKDIASY